MKKIQTLFLMAVCAISLQAQQFYTDAMQPQATTVNGLHLWGQYEYNQVVAALGVPQSYTDEVSTDEESAGMRIQAYTYPSGSCFYFHNKRFVEFHLESSSDSILINGALKVGDTISKVFSVFQPSINHYSFETSAVFGPYLNLYVSGGGEIYIKFYYSEATGIISSAMFYTMN
jgi:hypothetical protein